jgi:hypothetical protein
LLETKKLIANQFELLIDTIEGNGRENFNQSSQYYNDAAYQHLKHHETMIANQKNILDQIQITKALIEHSK